MWLKVPIICILYYISGNWARAKRIYKIYEARLGAVCDLEVDLCSGTVCSIVVPGPPKMWGLLKSDEELVIPFCKINKIGDDVILVDIML